VRERRYVLAQPAIQEYMWRTLTAQAPRSIAGKCDMSSAGVEQSDDLNGKGYIRTTNHILFSGCGVGPRVGLRPRGVFKMHACGPGQGKNSVIGLDPMILARLSGLPPVSICVCDSVLRVSELETVVPLVDSILDWDSCGCAVLNA